MRLRSIWTRRRTGSAASVAIASALALLILGGGASPAAAGWAGGFGHGPAYGPGLGAPYAGFGGIFDHPGSPAFGGFGFGGVPGAAPTVIVGADPVGVAFDPATQTLYVANGSDNTMSVISTAHCNARNSSDCDQTPPAVTVGSDPLSVAIDQHTRTVYVTNAGGNTVSMINAATCNGTNTSGCAQQSVTVGDGPDLLAVDQSTNTVYVPNGGDNTVSVFDAATCNAVQTSGCTDVSTFPVGQYPAAVTLDENTRTAYVANYNDGTVSVINAATCDATIRTGCVAEPHPVTVGPKPDALVVDEASNTVYVAIGAAGDASLGAVAMINSATCNADVPSGCAQTPRTTPVGSGPEWTVENPATRTVYIANQEDSDLSVINAATCNATDSFGCHQTPPALLSGLSDGGVDVDSATDTVYAASQTNNTVSVLNGATCNGMITVGCTRFAPTTTVGNAPQGSAVDDATGTIYVGNENDNDLSVIDGASCNAFAAFGCTSSWPIVDTGASPFAVAVDQRTDTVYVANADFGASSPATVSVINGATCNAHVSSGCTQTPAAVTVGFTPYGVAVDEATDTIYVDNVNFSPPGVGSASVSVINGARCNATVRSGCGLTPYSIPWVNDAPFDVAVDQATDTLYVTNILGGTVSVIDGATCNGHVTSDCSVKGDINVGPYPWGLAINQATDTIYVADQGSDAGNSGVSVIDGATCNATNQSGCSQTPATLGAGTEPNQITVDQATGAVYATSEADTATDVFNGSTCNATTTSGCAQTPVSVPVGGYPGNPVVDDGNATVYVPDDGDGEVSYFWAGL
jgi:DNA-binding beta-propeller fold protein YncE